MSIVKLIAARLRAADEGSEEAEDPKVEAEIGEVQAMFQKALRTIRPTEPDAQGRITLKKKTHFGTVISLLAKARIMIDFQPAQFAYKGSIYGKFQGVRITIHYDMKGICTGLDVYNG